MQDSATFVKQIYAVLHFTTQDIHFPSEIKSCEFLSCLQIVFHFLEYPRATETGTAYHYGINAISVETFLCPLRSGYIAISYDRNMHTRIVLYLTYESPVSLACVHLRACTSMNSQSLDTAVLQLLSQFHYYLMFRIPSQTCFHRNRYLNSIYHSFCYLKHFRHILQHARTGSLAGHTLDRTPEVQIQYIRFCLLYYLCCLNHSFCILTVNLYGYGTLLLADIQLKHGLANRTNQGIAGNELGIYHIGSKLLTKEAKRRVCNIFHRSQKHRLFSQIYISNFHNVYSFNTMVNGII